MPSPSRLSLLSALVKHRVFWGFLCLLIALVTGVVARLQVEELFPAQLTLAHGEATLHFEADRTAVWQVGDCVNLSWAVQNIREIYWSQGPTVGLNTTPWCLRRQVDIPFFTIHLQDGTVLNMAPFDVHTVSTQLFISLIPLLLLAAACFRLYQIPIRLFERLPETLRLPFTVCGRAHPLLVGLFLCLNGIVLWNAIDHHPQVGYDAEGHYANVFVLAQGRLPTTEDSGEFFSPPLPYAFPALASHISGVTGTCESASSDCFAPIRKLGQLQNVLVSLVATFVLLRIGARLQPDSVTPRAVALFLLAALPVYYKSFAFMRGEPFVVLFTLMLCDHLLGMLQRMSRFRDAITIGFCGGMLILSRQWGALVLLGVSVWWLLLLIRKRPAALRLFVPALAGGAIALVLGGWFYLAMFNQNGTFLAFNRSPDNAGKPATFFTGTGGDNLFRYPFSPGYDGQAVPVFYTEIWGDYFGYFHLQRPPIASLMPINTLSYMSMVNALSLLPTLVLLLAFVYGIYQTIRLFWAHPAELNVAHSLFAVCILTSLAGFIWFLASYPSGDADTAKATYVLHGFPLLCLLAGDAAYRFKSRFPIAFTIVLVGVVIVAIHNLPMCFSRIPG